jgi:hypothetical protein
VVRACTHSPLRDPSATYGLEVPMFRMALQPAPWLLGRPSSACMLYGYVPAGNPLCEAGCAYPQIPRFGSIAARWTICRVFILRREAHEVHPPPSGLDANPRPWVTRVLDLADGHNLPMPGHIEESTWFGPAKPYEWWRSIIVAKVGCGIKRLEYVIGQDLNVGLRR